MLPAERTRYLSPPSEPLSAKVSKPHAQTPVATDLELPPPVYKRDVVDSGKVALTHLPTLPQPHSVRSIARTPPDASTESFPNCFICPWKNVLLTDPVLALDGFSYNRTDIEAHFAAQRKRADEAGVAFVPTSPVTGLPLPNFDGVPATLLLANRPLKAALETFQRDPFSDAWRKYGNSFETLDAMKMPGALYNADESAQKREHDGNMFDFESIGPMVQSSVEQQRENPGRRFHDEDPVPVCPLTRAPFGAKAIFIPNHALRQLCHRPDKLNVKECSAAQLIDINELVYGGGGPVIAAPGPQAPMRYAASTVEEEDPKRSPVCDPCVPIAGGLLTLYGGASAGLGVGFGHVLCGLPMGTAVGCGVSVGIGLLVNGALYCFYASR